MRQSDPLGFPGGSRGELNVGRLVHLYPVSQTLHPLKTSRAGVAQDLSKLEGPRVVQVGHHDDGLQAGDVRALDPSCWTGPHLWSDAGEELVIVLSLEAVGRHQALHPHLVEAVLQLLRLVGGVDVDQDQAGLGCSELSEIPLVVVWSPDTQSVSRLEPQVEQSSSQALHLLLHLDVGPPDVLVSHHQRLSVSVLLSCQTTQSTSIVASVFPPAMSTVWPMV